MTAVEVDFRDLLRRLAAVKMELNHLYTEVPHETSDGPDWGWYCREHALNTYLLLKLLGLETSICLGVIVIEDVDKETIVSCYGLEHEHAWCEVRELGPVDLSVELAYFKRTMVRHEFVVGAKGLNGCEVIYEKDSTAFECALNRKNSKPRIMYLEQQRLAATVDELVEDPFCFLIRPPDGGLPTLFGKGVFTAVSLHLLKVFYGQRQPIFTEGLPFTSRLQKIVSENPGADAQFMEMMRNGK